MTAKELEQKLKALGSKERAIGSARFFKTGKGQYGEGDIFLGISVLILRKTALGFRDMPLGELEKMLASPLHEVRYAALEILVAQFEKGDNKTQKQIFDFYISHLKGINNWDLVDTSAPYIAGAYWYKQKKQIPMNLVRSKNMWERRIAIVATQHMINQGDATEALRVAELLLGDSEDLIHKATGWMLREVGKRCSPKILEDFLETYAAKMPRTALRYALEHFPSAKRKHFMNLG